MDLHTDIGVALFTGNAFTGKGFEDGGPNSQLDLVKAHQGGYRWVVSAVFPGLDFTDPSTGKVRVTFGCSRCVTLEQVKAITSITRVFPKRTFIVSNASDLDKATEDSLGLIIGLEGSYPLSEPEDLIELFNLGIRVLGLTWNVENGFAASCMSKKDYGLTKSGEELVRLANELGVVIDLAHSSRNTMIDVLTISKKPILISHTAAKALNDHPRNVDDEVLSLLKKNGGVVGVAFVPSFLRKDGKASMKDVVDHAIHMVDVAGPEHVGIGSDFLGTESLPVDLPNASVIQKLLKALIAGGLSENVVEGIAWRNAYRVVMNVLPK
jgi:membrane dipeptidase